MVLEQGPRRGGQGLAEVKATKGGWKVGDNGTLQDHALRSWSNPLSRIQPSQHNCSEVTGFLASCRLRSLRNAASLSCFCTRHLGHSPTWEGLQGIRTQLRIAERLRKRNLDMEVVRLNSQKMATVTSASCASRGGPLQSRFYRFPEHKRNRGED